MKAVFRARSFVCQCATVFLLVMSIGALGTTPALGDNILHKKKGLSLTSVTVIGGSAATSTPLWIAQSEGFFKNQGGLNVNFLVGTSGATMTTTLISGSVQFGIDQASSDLQAAEQGAPVRAVEMPDQDSQQELVITQTAAAQFHVPQDTGTTANATAQLEALKGSHILVGVSSLTSTSYIEMGFELKHLGITFGIGCTSCDIDLVSTGTPTTLQAALLTNKVQGIVNAPPVTVFATPATVTIEFWRLSPLRETADLYLSTTVNMVQQHSDTVQAIVTGMVEAAYWLKTHASAAEKIAASAFANYAGITSPEEAQYLYAGVVPFFAFPFPSKLAFDNIVLQNNVMGAPLKITYSEYVITRFATKAGKMLQVKLT